MLGLPLFDDKSLRSILVVGSHADDIEIGCGATLLAATRARPELEVRWVVLAAEGERRGEARASAGAFLQSTARSTVDLHDFRDGYFPYVGNEIKDIFEVLKAEAEPDLIFTHSRHDLHQDHRLVCELTWNTWREHVIFEYEIPKYDGDLGCPNVFVDIPEELAREKTKMLLERFQTQGQKHWFDAELFLGLMRLRGMESRSPSGYAEAFTCRKLALSVL